MAGGRGNGVIFEFITVGSYVKVTAVDPISGTEATIVGDPMRGENALRQAALRKLEYVLEKQRSGGRS